MPKGKAAPKQPKSAKAPKPKARPPPSAPPTPRPAPAPPQKLRPPTAAERKAALERLLEEEEVPLRALPPRPQPTPEFVRRASAAERKAAVEALARAETGLFEGRPLPAWKRKGEAPPRRPIATAAARPAAPAPAPAAAPPPRPAPATSSARRVVLLDTNALMMQFQFHVDVEGELRRVLDFAYDIVVPDAVVHELEELVKATSGKDQQEARMALELSKHFRQMEAPAPGDAGILRLAEKHNAIVVTNDKLLRARLRAKDLPNIHLRSRAFLTLEGHVTGV